MTTEVRYVGNKEEMIIEIWKPKDLSLETLWAMFCEQGGNVEAYPTYLNNEVLPYKITLRKREG